MPYINRLTGSPWHVDKWTRKEGDERRHKSRCVYLEKSDNHCRKNYGKCCGSAHCYDYKEFVVPETSANVNDKKSCGSSGSEKMKTSANVNGVKTEGFFVGQRVKSSKFGFGIIIDVSSNIMTIHFENGEVKKFDIKICAKKQIFIPV